MPPFQNDKNTFAVLSRMQRIVPKFKRKTEPPNKAVVGDTKKGKEGGRRGPYSESGDRAASVSRRTADDSYCSSQRQQHSLTPLDGLGVVGDCSRLTADQQLPTIICGDGPIDSTITPKPDHQNTLLKSLSFSDTSL